MLTRRQAAFYAILLVCVGALLLYLLCFAEDRPPTPMAPPNKYVVGSDRKVYEYNREMPLISVNGVPDSGNALMRAMLDAHPDVRCGPETRVIPLLLHLRFHLLESKNSSLHLEEVGITEEVLDSAIAAFSLEIIVKQGEPAPRLCNKDPLMLGMGSYIVDLFPNVKFIFMVRDGRAVVHSLITRKVAVPGFNLTNYRQCLETWNDAVETMNYHCVEFAPERCLQVPYEQLVLHPRAWMEKVLRFLDIPWNEAVLRHRGVNLSTVKPSSGRFVEPVNLEALTEWVGAIPDDILEDMAEIAPMLSVLGYNPYANPPNYEKPDEEVFMWEKKAKEMFSNQGEEREGGNRVLDKESTPFKIKK